MAFSAFIIFCFALALISGADRALLYDDLHYQNKQQHYHKIFGLYNALSIGALAFSSFIGGWIADQQYWFFYLGIAAQFIAFGLMMTVGDVYQVKKTQGETVVVADGSVDLQETEVRSKKALFFMLIAHPVALLIIVIGILQDVFSSIVLYYQEILAEFSINMALIGLVYSGSFIFSAFSSVISGHIAEKITEQKSIIIFLVMLCLMLMVSYVFPSASMMIIQFVFLLICYEIIDTSLNVILNHRIASDQRSFLQSVANSLGSLIMVGTFGLIGYFSEQYVLSKLITLYAILAAVIALGLFIYYLRRERKSITIHEE
ncbi:MFS transporter [Avibacterium gallinarum]|uniref:MFS transporter n=2 Tax=Avibacterium gallinarum TaxID=755 RepID=A0A379AYU9_AVIGA|nr:MFS transporter [Avibacterium gallinarum]SUB27830.1 Major Facilitator Superfamily [Avibacterium gallinarum]